MHPKMLVAIICVVLLVGGFVAVGLGMQTQPVGPSSGSIKVYANEPPSKAFREWHSWTVNFQTSDAAELTGISIWIHHRGPTSAGRAQVLRWSIACGSSKFGPVIETYTLKGDLSAEWLTFKPPTGQSFTLPEASSCSAGIQSDGMNMIGALGWPNDAFWQLGLVVWGESGGNGGGGGGGGGGGDGNETAIYDCDGDGSMDSAVPCTEQVVTPQAELGIVLIIVAFFILMLAVVRRR